MNDLHPPIPPPAPCSPGQRDKAHQLAYWLCDPFLTYSEACKLAGLSRREESGDRDDTLVPALVAAA